MNKLLKTVLNYLPTVAVMLAFCVLNLWIGIRNGEVRGYRISQEIAHNLLERNHNEVNRLRDATSSPDLFEEVVLDFVHSQALEGNCPEAEELAERYLTGKMLDSAKSLADECFEENSKCLKEMQRLYDQYCAPEAETGPTSL